MVFGFIRVYASYPPTQTIRLHQTVRNIPLLSPFLSICRPPSIAFSVIVFDDLRGCVMPTMPPRASPASTMNWGSWVVLPLPWRMRVVRLCKSKALRLESAACGAGSASTHSDLPSYVHSTNIISTVIPASATTSIPFHRL